MSRPLRESERISLENLHNLHVNELIPELTKYDRKIRESVIYFSDTHLESTQFIRSNISDIAKLQAVLTDLPPSIRSVSDALRQQSTAFKQILHINRTPLAWGAALVEIVRRKVYSKMIAGKIGEMSDILVKLRKKEEIRRVQFSMGVERYIPANLLSAICGLQDPLPTLENAVPNGKIDNLPDLNPEDINEFNLLVSDIRKRTVSRSSNDALSQLEKTMGQIAQQMASPLSDFEKLLLNSCIVS